MKTMIREPNLNGSTHWLTQAIAVLLLPLNWAVPASDKTPANPSEASAVAVENRVTAAPTAQPEVWLCAGERLADLLRPNAEWPFVRQHLAGIKLYVDQINQAAPEQLAALVRLVKEHRYQVAVELGGCLDFAPMNDTAGEWSARLELAKIAKFYAAGGRVDFLDVDGPIRRLMHPDNRRDGRRFDSVEKAADELINALRLHRQAHPDVRFWLLSNFPNWGWRGDVSYHARGPKRQDYGDDYEVVHVVLRKLQAAGLALEGVTVDNPYDYLIGEHRSVNLKDPKSVDWLGRVRSYENFAREQGLAFNLIVNSERGGQESDERFSRETLQMVDLYRQAGGRPTRWFVQSWYPYPQQIVPETAPHSMTALVKSVIEKVDPGAAAQSRRETPTNSQTVRVIDLTAYGKDAPEAQGVPHELVMLPEDQGGRGLPSDQEMAFLGRHLGLSVASRSTAERPRATRSAETSPIARRQATRVSGRIALQPQPGAMQVTARVPGLDNQAFALGIPETIGCREAMLVNFPEARIEWQGPDADGVVSCTWGPGGRISYSLRLLPAEDYVDVEMTVRNHTEFLWHDVFAFNCLNPIEAPSFQDWKLERTYMSKQGKPFCMAQTKRVIGHMPTVGFYLPERIQAGEESVFVRGFAATSPDRTDGSWIVTLSEPAGTYMAATAMEAAFLFDNMDRCCLHAAPGFGDIGPGEGSTTVSRLYLARGTLNDFLKRLETDRPGLIARQKWARSTGSASDSGGSSSGASAAERRATDETKPHGRMEEMSPDELEKVLKQAPIAFVPLGTFEHHGWHLPVCFDGIKAHALCERVAERTGGTVLPTFFYGTGGGHVGYKWTLMLAERQIAPLIEATLDHLARQGFKVVVLFTGHYPQEQVDMVHRLSQEAQKRHALVKFIGLTEPEITSPQPGDAYGGDHAAKYETSIALALNPRWVHMDQLTAGRDPTQAALPETPRSNASTHDPTHPLYAIHGQDPRTNASKELGEKLVAEIVSRLARQVEEALNRVSSPPIAPAAPGGAMLTPPSGRVVHGMGQWEAYNAKLLPALPVAVRPAAQLLFIDIGDTPRGWRPQGIAARLLALGREGFVPVLDIGLRGNQPTKAELDQRAEKLFGIDHEVASSTRFDSRLDDLAKIIREFGQPVLVRIGGEFNGWWNGYHPYAYPQAFRKIVGIFREAGIANAAFVWCYEPSAPGDFDEQNAQGQWKWFPGDDLVDWFSIDWFNKEDFTGPLTSGRQGGEPTAHGRTRKFLDWAVTHRKPVIVAESAPCRYDLSVPQQAKAAWREWFEPYFQIMAERREIKWFHLISYDWTRSSYFAQTGWKNNDFTANQTLLDRLIEELKKPRYLHASEKVKLAGYQTMTLASAVPSNSAAAPTTPRSSVGSEALKSEGQPSPLTLAAAAQSGSSKLEELAKWDDAAKHRSPTGPGGTEWDGAYRSFIQTDENATSKGFPSHAEAAKQILADAAKSSDNRHRHLGWVLFLKHFSQAYRPESATVDLKRLYEDLVALEFRGESPKETLPFYRDARLTIYRDVVYGQTHPEIQKLDAYLVKSAQPTPVVIEIHGGGWRRGGRSQFVYPDDLIGAILKADISVISIDYRLTPQHPMPAQMDDVVRAVQFVRSKAKAWNLDPDRMAAMGGSAGAHLAAWVALHDNLAKPDSPDPLERLSSRLACFVALSGPMDLTRVLPTELARQPLRGQDFANAFTAAFACTEQQYEKDDSVRRKVREASPLFLVSSNDPPAFLMAAAGETMDAGQHPPVPLVINDPHSAWHSVLLADALKTAGVSRTCRIGPQVGKNAKVDNAAILDFLRRQLSTKERRP